MPYHLILTIGESLNLNLNMSYVMEKVNAINVPRSLKCIFYSFSVKDIVNKCSMRIGNFIVSLNVPMYSRVLLEKI